MPASIATCVSMHYIYAYVRTCLRRRRARSSSSRRPQLASCPLTLLISPRMPRTSPPSWPRRRRRKRRSFAAHSRPLRSRLSSHSRSSLARRCTTPSAPYALCVRWWPKHRLLPSPPNASFFVLYFVLFCTRSCEVKFRSFNITLL